MKLNLLQNIAYTLKPCFSNFPPAEEEEEVAEEPASEGDQDQVKLEPLPKGEGEDAQQKVSGQQEESIKAPRQPPSIKGKERVGDDSSTAPILGGEWLSSRSLCSAHSFNNYLGSDRGRDIL